MPVTRDCCSIVLRSGVEAQAHFDFEIEDAHPLILLHKVVQQDNALEKPVDLMPTLCTSELDDVVRECIEYVKDIISENVVDAYDYHGDR